MQASRRVLTVEPMEAKSGVKEIWLWVGGKGQPTGRFIPKQTVNTNGNRREESATAGEPSIVGHLGVQTRHRPMPANRR